jgi:preprotein translocase subunit SecG
LDESQEQVIQSVNTQHLSLGRKFIFNRKEIGMFISKSIKVLFVIFLIASLISACGINVEFSDNEIEPTSAATDAPLTETEEVLPPALPGGVSGDLSYPSEFIPPLRVVAFRLENGQPNGDFNFIVTSENQSTYQIDGLEPGQYWVVAYTIPAGEGIPQGLAGGYSKAVPCGLSVDCNDHSLIAVDVLAGQLTGGIDPTDWYAPEGTFPPDPNN